MTVPRLEITLSPITPEKANIVVIFAKPSEGSVTLLAPQSFAWVHDLIGPLGITGAAHELIKIPGRTGTPTVVAISGLGDAPGSSAFRDAAGAAIRRLEYERIAIEASEVPAEALPALMEGAGLGGYRYDKYRDSKRAVVNTVIIHAGDSQDLSEDIVTDYLRDALIVAESVALAKNLVNTPPCDLDPATFVDRAHSAVANTDVTTRVWHESELEAGQFGGLLGVGSGSVRPPRLMRLDYAPADANRHIALVGKGITFDSGGLSLKPPASMVGMKYDMAGAATALAVLVAIARLELPIRLTAWLCLAENLPSGSAMRPNDVLRMRNGKTVEVLNTDAEGRLVLADGLAAASEEYPNAIIDIATLTGAKNVALGDRYTGAMGASSLITEVLSAADQAGEPFWPMPLPRELGTRLRSHVADMVNSKPGNRDGGMLVAGLFLREFVGPMSDAPGAPAIPWLHLDIAGSAHNDSDAWGFTGPGATGISVRTLINLCRNTLEAEPSGVKPVRIVESYTDLVDEVKE